MNATEVHTLGLSIHALYPTRFPALVPAMADAWLERLQHIEFTLAKEGVQRWIWRHTFYPPSLDELLEQIELVRDENRPLPRPRGASLTYGQVLTDAAETQAANPERTSDDIAYGRYQALLGIRSVDVWEDEEGVAHPKMTHIDRAKQCETWAREMRADKPTLAGYLDRAAQIYYRTAPPIAVSREPGDEDVSTLF